MKSRDGENGYTSTGSHTGMILGGSRLRLENDRIEEALCDMAGKENVFRNEDMGKHVTFKAGGKADFLVMPAGIKSLAACLSYVTQNHIPYYVMGNGSNLLVKEEGYQGVILKIGNAFSDIRVNIEKHTMELGAGVYLSKAASTALENGFSGMEFAAGIPGMIGGAVAMNAGAYGGEMKDIVEKVWVMNREGKELILPNQEMQFGYRTSILQKEPLICLGVTLRLQEGQKAVIAEKMQELMEARREKQPLEYPSAGSTFKRPEGYFAGKLIMEAGLKGFHVGDACVSEKHCGFVVNKGNATAGEIQKVIDKVAEIVYKKSGVQLEPEVKII